MRDIPGRPLRRMWRGEERKDFVEGALSLILCNLGDYVSGFFLQFFSPIIRSAPILLALLPAASDARGDVYSSYGSRLGTLLHLGLAKKMIREELAALLAILISINTWIGLLTMLAAWGLHAERGVDASTTILTALSSALIAAPLMVTATTWLAFTSFRRGIDPDNVVAPIATLFGDIVTIPTIVLGYEASLRLPLKARLAVILSLLGAAACISLIIAFRVRLRGSYRRAWEILRQNLLAIIASTTLSMAAGIILLANMEKIIAGAGILAVIPAFLEDGGAIASRFSARLSTSLHLGRVTLSLAPRDRWILVQLVVNMVHASIIFSALGVFGYLMALWGGATSLWGFKIMAAVVSAGLMLTILVSIITYYTALASFNLGVDPDNVLAPILTSIADVLGTALLASMLLILAL